jgi:acyl-CoA reductase-like NAD-dependent aldehyde dehydrogenase
MKRVNLELGGSAPVILLDDADLGSAVPQIVRAAIFMSGQQCVAASRLLVSSKLLQEAMSLFARALMGVVVGPGSEPATQMGPMIDLAARDRILRMLDAVSAPDEIVVRGAVLGGDQDVGAYVTPSLVHVRDPQSPLITDEIFGPILSALTPAASVLPRVSGALISLAPREWRGGLKLGQSGSTCTAPCTLKLKRVDTRKAVWADSTVSMR